VDGVEAGGRDKRDGIGPGALNGCCVTEIVVCLFHSTMEKIKVNVGVVGACAAQGHVAGVLGECLHGRCARALPVTVRIAGVKRTVVVEH
jgi:hypothetical protein